MAHEFIYTCYKLGRFYPPDRKVLENISLSFYPGAKIGVHRRRTAPASRSLLRIMAGVDDGYTGEARLTPGFTVGFLAQEPQLDPAKDVIGNVMDGVAAVQSTARPVRRGHGEVGRPRRRLREARRASRPSSRTRSTPPTRGTSSATSRSPWTRCAARPATPTSPRCPAASGAGSRCAGCCSSRPDLLLLDEPTNHLDAESVAWLERFLQDYPGTVVAITHDRYFLDNVAGWILELDRGRGIPFEGNYSSLARAEAGAPARSEEKPNAARQRTLERELEWVRMAPKARQAKGKARLAAYEKLLAEAEGGRARRRQARDHDPRRAAPRRHRDRGRRTCARATATGC